jgi:hypothetical protein
VYIKQCEGCKYYRDIDLGNKHLLGSRYSGYCSYHPKTTRGQLRSISRISDCKIIDTGEGDNRVNNQLNIRY